MERKTLTDSAPLQVHFTILPAEAGPLPSTLDREERGRAARFRNPRARLQFVEGRRLLRTVLSRELGLEPGEIPLRLSPEGRPELAGACRGLLHLSTSHSGTLVVVVVDAGGPVGVDVEVEGPVLPERDAILRRIATPGERATLPAPSGGADPAFRRLWCRKEAVAKATGQGLAIGLRAVEDPGGGEEAPDWVRFRGEVGREWQVADLPGLPRGFVGAVALAATRMPPPPIPVPEFHPQPPGGAG